MVPVEKKPIKTYEHALLKWSVRKFFAILYIRIKQIPQEKLLLSALNLILLSRSQQNRFRAERVPDSIRNPSAYLIGPQAQCLSGVHFFTYPAYIFLDLNIQIVQYNQICRARKIKIMLRVDSFVILFECIVRVGSWSMSNRNNIKNMTIYIILFVV